MGLNFVTGDREQSFLLAPDMRDWLLGEHLAWFVIDVVDQLDLQDFRRAYRADGHGRPAYDPAIMVALLRPARRPRWRSVGAGCDPLTVSL